MKKITFGTTKNQHICTTTKQGDFIIYKCPLCNDYERRFNTKTGAMSVKCDKGNRNLDSGSYVKAGLDLPFNQN